MQKRSKKNRDFFSRKKSGLNLGTHNNVTEKCDKRRISYKSWVLKNGIFLFNKRLETKQINVIWSSVKRETRIILNAIELTNQR